MGIITSPSWSHLPVCPAPRSYDAHRLGRKDRSAGNTSACSTDIGNTIISRHPSYFQSLLLLPSTNRAESRAGYMRSCGRAGACDQERRSSQCQQPLYWHPVWVAGSGSTLASSQQLARPALEKTSEFTRKIAAVDRDIPTSDPSLVPDYQWDREARGVGHGLLSVLLPRATVWWYSPIKHNRRSTSRSPEVLVGEIAPSEDERPEHNQPGRWNRLMKSRRLFTLRTREDAAVGAQ